ncbi:MAG TPA: helix-turn-helix domain-containing protein [Actinomycetota bacterium]|nr:helix-turn-helix domain-containing protein [Actinomycetota bacterium]
MARKRQPPVADADRREIGGLLRTVRRAAGYRSVEAAALVRGCPAARQTIYAYERGGLVPSLQQFLELVEFYATKPSDGSKTEEDLRAQAVAAIARAIALDAYHFTDAMALMQRLQPKPAGRPRRC